MSEPPTGSEEGLANKTPQAKASMPPVSISTDLHSHTHLIVRCLWLLSCDKAGGRSGDRGRLPREARYQGLHRDSLLTKESMVLPAHVTFSTSGTSAERAASVPLWAVSYAMADVHPGT